MLDVPNEVRNKVIGEGNAAWLDELPSQVESLAQEWSLTLGATLRGGHAAFVVEATTADGVAAVLKIGVPGTRRDLTFEATALRLANGDGCASLLRDDLDRGALLLERLGAALYDVVPDPTTRHDMMCDILARLWRPVSPDLGLPTGADKALEYSDLLPRLWEETGYACSEATVEDALACLVRRRRAHDDRDAVLVHGDVHDLNVLQAAYGGYKLIDPGGYRAERAYDLGTIIRCNPGSDDHLYDRANRLAARAGVDAGAIWDWGTIHRVIGGLYSRRIGLQPFGDLLLAEADRLTG
jgi:streptomycin 6-kinase